MELIEFAELTPRRRAEVEGDEHDPFDSAEIPIRFRAKDQHVGPLAGDGTLVASAGLVVAEVQAGQARFPVVGLGGVIVRAELRGRGLAREVVEAAVAKAKTLGPPFVLLFCHENRAGLYRRLGFTPVEGAMLVEQPGAYVPLRVAMWRALRPGVRWPDGQLVLHGLPF